MAEPAPLKERSAEDLTRGLTEGEFNIREAFLARRILQERQRQQRRRGARWSLLVALIGAAFAASLITATVIGLLR